MFEIIKPNLVGVHGVLPFDHRKIVYWTKQPPSNAFPEAVFAVNRQIVVEAGLAKWDGIEFEAEDKAQYWMLQYDKERALYCISKSERWERGYRVHTFSRFWKSFKVTLKPGVPLPDAKEKVFVGKVEIADGTIIFAL